MVIALPLVRVIFILIASCLALQAGESLTISGPRAYPVVEANSGDMAPWRAEFQIHDWTSSGSNLIAIDMNGTGFEAAWVSSTVLGISDKRDTATGSYIELTPSETNFVVRVQRNPTSSPVNGFPAMTFAVEMWNNDGTGYQFGTNPITVVGSWANTNGAWGDGGDGVTEHVGFYRVMNTLVPLHSLQPVTANPACPGSTCLTEYKVDGNLTDTSGNCSSSCITISSAAYIATPGQTAFAFVSTDYLPSVLSAITQVTPLRAGNAGQLNGASSFSMIDASSAVTYFWQILTVPSGAPPPVLSSHTASRPTVSQTVFGDYMAQLQVTDTSGNVATASTHVGAVAMDANSIVIDAQPAYSRAVWGDQIAFGHNLWAYQDWANVNAANAVGSQIGSPSSGTKISADWNVALSGTCYLTGTTGVNPGTATCAGLNTQNVWCGGGTKWKWYQALANTAYSVGDWAEDPNGNFEQVTASTGSTGSNPPSWPASGDTGTMTVWGSVTFTSEGTATGQQWPIVWYSDPNNAGRVGRDPQLPLGCPSSTTLSLDFVDYGFPYIGTSCTMAAPCQMATSYNWLLAINNGSGSYGYYDGATMFEALYRRTGLLQYDTWGQVLDDIEVHAPGIDDGVIIDVQARVNPSRQWTWPVVYNGSTNYTLGLRNFATNFGQAGANGYPGFVNQPIVSQNTATGVVNCFAFCINDVRERGAEGMDVASECYVENDPTLRTSFCGLLEQWWLNVWAPLVQSDGHWDSTMGYNGTVAGPVSSFTQGSATVTTASTYASTLCGTVITKTGTVTVVNGSSSIVGSGTHFTSASPNDVIVIYGTYSGVYGKQIAAFATITDDTHAVLSNSVPVNLDSAAGLSFMVNDNPVFVVLKTDASGNYQPLIPNSNWYTCTYVDATHLTLDQPYVTTSEYGNMSFGYSEGGAGQGTDSFMSSFPAAALELGALAGTTHSAQMAAAAHGLYPYYSGAAWVPTTKGMHYATGFPVCTPPFDVNYVCSSPQQNARMFGVEPVRALGAAYLANPTTPENTFLTQMYGAQWGNPAYGSSPYSDGGFVDDCADGFSAASFWKYAYQCFAMGATASMPAALLGGVAPAVNRTVQLGFNLAAHANATHATVAVTAPTGVVTTTACASSPCSFTVDDRQGTHTAVLSYLSSGGSVVAVTLPTAIY